MGSNKFSDSEGHFPIESQISYKIMTGQMLRTKHEITEHNTFPQTHCFENIHGKQYNCSYIVPALMAWCANVWEAVQK